MAGQVRLARLSDRKGRRQVLRSRLPRRERRAEAGPCASPAEPTSSRPTRRSRISAKTSRRHALTVHTVAWRTTARGRARHVPREPVHHARRMRDARRHGDPAPASGLRARFVQGAALRARTAESRRLVPGGRQTRPRRGLQRLFLARGASARGTRGPGVPAANRGALRRRSSGKRDPNSGALYRARLAYPERELEPGEAAKYSRAHLRRAEGARRAGQRRPAASAI